MRSEAQTMIDAIRKSLALLSRRMDRDTADKRLSELDGLLEDPDLWDEPKRAQELMKRRQELSESIESYDSILRELEDAVELIDMAIEENESEVVAEAEAALSQLQERTSRMELEALLDGEADENDAFVEINAGAGGTESCDWASMLSRMYERWAQRRGFKVETISQNRDGEAGLKSISYRFSGHNVYGWLKTEAGVHRLVRISPFDSSARRHTSFSSVSVYPVVDENIEIEINPAELRVDTFRASGAGGQHVNKTDSAVRMTHLPTGIVVTSSEKSQHQNRAICMNALKSKLYDLELRKRSEKVQEMHSQKGSAGWGNQIRSYVLQPYQQVKDLRTNVESTNPQQVLDGDLDDFMAAVLAQDAVGKPRADLAQLQPVRTAASQD